MRSVDQLRSDILSAAHEKRSRVLNKRKGRRTLADVNALCRSAWEDGQRRNGLVLSRIITKKDQRLLKDHLIKRLEGSDYKPEAVIEWVTENWQAIGAQHFTRSKRYPEAPAFPWFIACLDTYLQAYHHKDTLDPTMALSHTERAKHSERAQRAAARFEAATIEANEVKQLTAAENVELRREVAALRKQLGLPPTDDPVYNKAIRRAKRRQKQFPVGKWDESVE